jgi:ankyrin repeat protein
MMIMGIVWGRRRRVLVAALFLLASVFLCQGDQSSSTSTSYDNDLLEAAFNGNVPGVRAAIMAGANPNAQDPGSGQTALMGATLRGHTNIVQLLLSSEYRDRVDVTIAEKDGYTPAHGAGFQGRADIMQVLFDHQINIKDDFHSDGYAPIHRACWGREQRHTDTVRLLGALGVDLRLPGRKNGGTVVCADMTTNPATQRLLLDETAEEL